MIHAMLAQNETDAALKKVITTHIYDTQGVEQALQEVSYIQANKQRHRNVVTMSLQHHDLGYVIDINKRGYPLRLVI